MKIQIFAVCLVLKSLVVFAAPPQNTPTIRDAQIGDSHIYCAQTKIPSDSLAKLNSDLDKTSLLIKAQDEHNYQYIIRITKPYTVSLPTLLTHTAHGYYGDVDLHNVCVTVVKE